MSAGRGDDSRPDWAGLPPAALAGWLARRRWSGARGAAIEGVQVAAVVPVPLGDGAPPCALLVVEGLVGGAPTRWQLPLIAPDADDEAAPDDEPVVVLGGRALRDATAHAPFRDWLRRALADGATLDGRAAGGGAVRWTARAVGDAAWARESTPSRIGGAEQSNTSLLYGDATILKLFRRLEPGPQPDVEIGAALAASAFAHVPALRGVLALEADGASTVLGMAQALVPGARDAWALTVDAATAAVSDDGAGGRGLDDARRLGAATRALHAALAAVRDADFAPRAAAAADVRRWVDAAATAFDAALAAVAPGEGAGDAAAFVEARARLGALAARGAELRDRLDALGATVGDDAGAAIRHHGDYHLGQVLVDARGAYAIIDFEGEPARPLAERRARHSPLRDVAGMLRSFGYAAATALRAVDPDAAPDAPAAARADAWEHDARDAFLAGYFAEPAAGAPAFTGTAYLPAARAHADALLRIFELEKLFYELRYEVRNRPDWLPIPLRGLTALLADDAALTTGPR